MQYRGRMKKIILTFVFIVSGIALCIADGDPRSNKKFDIRRFDGRKITVRQVRPPRHIQGILPASTQVAKAAERFYKALESLPESFVKRSGLKYVTFYEQPQLRGQGVGGLACGDTIILDVNFNDKTVYHELFHIFDKARKQVKWTRLNDKQFVYTGSSYYPAKLSRKKRIRKDQNLADRKYDLDFASRYAMSNEMEDRAETFAHMVSEKERFLRRTDRSAVMKMKMEYRLFSSFPRSIHNINTIIT